MSEEAAMLARSGLAIGLFSPNCDGGLAITKVPERWRATWENNLELAAMCDAAGIDFVLPIGRWRGYGGESNFHGASLETLTWSCGLLAQTSRLIVFATVHAPMIHPIVAAKQLATIDHVSHGRLGLNLVCGWNEGEFQMFGQEQREHDDRYAYGQEWLDVVRLLWRSEEPTDYRGRYLSLPGLIGRPAPFNGEPIIVNAGYSSAGRAFAERNCDFILTSLVNLDSGRSDVETIKAGARSHGRNIDLIATAHVVCRPTRAEAQDYLNYYAYEEADWAAAETLMAGMGLNAMSFPPEHYQQYRERFASGHGTYPIIGSPDEVADEFERIHASGFAAVALGFVNYLDELPYFRDEVLPRLEAKGVRGPLAATSGAGAV